MLSDITLTKQALNAAIAAGDDAEVFRLEELEKAQWRMRDVKTEIGDSIADLKEARAAGDDAEVRRLEEHEAALRTTLQELSAHHPTEDQIKLAAQKDLIETLGVLSKRRRAARAAGDDAELHRLLEVGRPLRSRMAEIHATEDRRHAADRTSPDNHRLFGEARALWDEVIKYWRANPFDPHTI